MKKLKVAIVGVGNISQEHIKAYQKNPQVDLIAFCDVNKEQVEKMGELYGVSNLYTDLDVMLQNEEIDAVSICTWNSEHSVCAIKALNAGKHVLSEKPMAATLAEAEKMAEAAKMNQKTLMIGLVRRFGNDTKILLDFIDQGYFGEIYYSKAQYIRRNGNPGGWFSDKKRSGGGPLIDLGVHVIDLVRYLMGKPKVVSVYGATFKKLNTVGTRVGKPAYVSVSRSDEDINDVEDIATALIRFDNGAVLSVETSFSLNVKEDITSIELFGDKCGAKISPEIELYTEMFGHMTDVNFNADTALNFSGLFEGEINHFVDVVANGKECIAPAEDGVEIMKILDAIYRSAETEHEIILN